MLKANQYKSNNPRTFLVQGLSGRKKTVFLNEITKLKEKNGNMANK